MQPQDDLFWFCNRRNPRRICRPGSSTFCCGVALLVVFVIYNGTFVTAALASVGLATCSTRWCDEACDLTYFNRTLALGLCYLIPLTLYCVVVLMAMICFFIAVCVLSVKDDVMDAITYVPPLPPQAPL
jgi:hypothetical protein